MDEVLGSASVVVEVDLSRMGPGFAEAKRRTEQFQQQATAGFKTGGAAASGMATAVSSVARSVQQAATAEDQLAAAIAGTGRMSAAAVREMGGLAAVQKSVANSAKTSMEAWRQNSRAVTEAAEAQEHAVRVMEEMKNRADRLRGALNPLVAAQQKYAAAQKEADTLLRAGVISQTEHAAALNAAAAGYQRAQREAARMAKTGGLAAHEISNLTFQLNDVAVGLASGQSPFTVLLQQGSQIGQVLGMRPGGVGGAIKSLLSFITPARAAVAGVFTALAVGTKTVMDHADAQADLHRAVIGTGRAAGTTTDQLERMAQANAGLGRVSIQTAREIEVALLSTGKVSAVVFESIIRDQKRYAVATGQESKEATAELAKAFADPARGAEVLAEKIGAVDAETKKLIENLAKQGRTTEAQIILAKHLDDALKGQAENTTLMARSWDSVGRGIANAYDWLGKYIARGARGLPVVGEPIAQFQDADARFREQQEAAARRAAQRARMRNAGIAAEDIAKGVDPNSGRQDLINQRNALGLGELSEAMLGNTRQADRLRQARERLAGATETFLGAEEKAHRLAQLDIQAARARTPAAQAQIAAERVRIQLAGESISATERELRVKDAYSAALAQASESLNMEARAAAADARATMELADAYLESEAAGMRAEASRRAAMRAAQGDISFATALHRELTQAIASQAAEGAKLVASTRAQAEALRIANREALEEGVTMEVAQRSMQQGLTLRQLEAAADIASGAAKQKLIKIINDLRKAYGELNRQTDEQAVISENEARGEEAAALALELKLLGKTNRERDRALATLRATQNLDRKPGAGADLRAAGINSEVGIANARNRLEEGRFVEEARKQVEMQRRAYEANARAIGMTHKAAEAYRFEQDALNDAWRRGIELNEEQRAELRDLARQYGEVADAAREAERQQNAASEAADFFSRSFADGIIDLATHARSGKQIVKDFAKDLLDARLRGFLLGEGPLAGIQGTDKTRGPGQPNGGVLNQLFGGIFGVGKKQGAPTGNAQDPIWVRMGGGGPAANDNGGGILGGLLGGMGGGGGGMGIMPGEWDWMNKGGGILGGGGGSDVLSDGAGGDFLGGLSDIFKQNTQGGFLSGLGKIFGGGGGAAGGGGGIMGMLGGLFGGGGGGGGGGGLGGILSSLGGAGGGGGGIGGILGSLAASFFHDGLDPGFTSSPRQRQLPAQLFLAAPRLHGGLEPGEFPAILKQGEGVFDPAKGQRGGSGGGPVIINVNGVKDFAGFNRSDRQVARAYRQRFAG